MAIEQTSIRMVRKPWGSTDLRPWGEAPHDGIAVGELWFERAAADAPPPALLLKLLFTTAPLSIQVHPDDEVAQSVGLAHGKTEAWYILAAQPGAEIAIGLQRQLTAPQLRASIEDGSIADLVQWCSVMKGDVIFVPAGTIHAIGAGLVVAEIQQRSDATFRLFDYGRQRELHVEHGVAAASADRADRQPSSGPVAPKRLTDTRTLLVASPAFVLERVDLAPHSRWELRGAPETWLLVIEGHLQLGAIDASVGEAVFLDAERTGIAIGAAGLKGLLAYPGPEPRPDLLCALDRQNADIPARSMEVQS